MATEALTAVRASVAMKEKIMLRICLGTAPCNWNNDDVSDYRPCTPYPDLLDQMVEAGYTASEVATSLPADVAVIRRDFSARNLRPASTFCSVNLRVPAIREQEIARAEERARFLAALGVDVLIVADSGDARRQAIAGQVRPEDGLDDAAWVLVCAGLEAIAERCRAHGVRIAFHNHVGTYVETEAELIRLLEGTSPDLVGLCFDVGRLRLAGGDVLAVAEQYASRIWYVHLKDVESGGARPMPPRASRLPCQTPSAWAFFPRSARDAWISSDSSPRSTRSTTAGG